MPDRVARYKLEVDQASAKQEASKIAKTFADEMNKAQSSMASGASGSSGGLLGGLTKSLFGTTSIAGGGSLLGGGLLAGGIAGVLGATTVSLANMNTTMTRSSMAFTALSGSSAEAEKRLQAIQRASGGTMDKLTAMNLANRLVALGMAKSAGEMEKAVETGRKIAVVMGGDVQGALENLSLAAANLSYMRLDQMGISATKVRDRVKELTNANADLGKEQAFLQAAMETANETFKDIDTSAAVSGVEKLTTSWQNLREAMGEGLPGRAANAALTGFTQALEGYAANGDEAKAEEIRQKRVFGKNGTLDVLRYQEQQGSDSTRARMIEQAEQWQTAQTALNTAIKAGVPGLDSYTASMGRLLAAWESGQGLSAQQSTELAGIDFALKNVTNSTSGYSQAIKDVGSELASSNPKAQDLLAQIVQLDIAFANGQINLGGYNATLDILVGRLKDVKDQADKTTDALGATFRQQVLTAQGYKLDAQGNQIRDPRTGEFVRQSWAPDYNPATNSGQQQLEYEHQVAEDRKRADEQAAREWQSAAESTQREMEAAADQLVSEFKSKLDQIPGLMSTTSVTQDDMDAAAAGVYKQKPDEWLRELKDEVENGKDYANVDIHDAARRAGLDENLDPKAIYAQVASMWGDQSLFAGGKNLDLINSDAVMDALTRQDKSASGRDAIYKLFGITPDAATTQALTAGLSGGADVDPALANGVATTMGLDPAAAIAALQAGFNSDDTIKNLKDIGAGVADHIYAGFASGVGEQDWASPVLASLEGRLVTAVTAAISTQMQQP